MNITITISELDQKKAEDVVLALKELDVTVTKPEDESGQRPVPEDETEGGERPKEDTSKGLPNIDANGDEWDPAVHSSPPKLTQKGVWARGRKRKAPPKAAELPPKPPIENEAAPEDLEEVTLKPVVIKELATIMKIPGYGDWTSIKEALEGLGTIRESVLTTFKGHARDGELLKAGLQQLIADASDAADPLAGIPG